MRSTVTIRRQSNFELLRILAMFLIVLHHYCVNSGLSELINADLNNNNYHVNLFLVQFMSIGGKIGVNIFFIISGYFMLHKHMSFYKVWKIVFQVLFYNIVIFVLLNFFGGYHYCNLQIVEVFFPFIFTMDGDFVGNYLIIYILSPVINKGLKSLDKRDYKLLILVLFVYYILVGFFTSPGTWNYLINAFYMYVLGAYFMTYGTDFLTKKHTVIALYLTVLAFWMFEVIFDLFGNIGWLKWSSAFSSNSPIVYFASILMFVRFAQLKMSYNSLINILASSCFGIYLIHANCPQMRQFLWKDVFSNVDMYRNPLFIFHMSIKVVSVYLICAFIDMFRYKYIEKPLTHLILLKRQCI